MARLAAIVLIAICVSSAPWAVGGAEDSDATKKREPLPNGYEVFFANEFEAAIVKDGVNFNACVAGPNVVELGSSGRYIFGRIDPKKDIPPHPDHAPGFFLIDSATDKTTTGLERKKWLAALKAVGIDPPELVHPKHIDPKRF